MKSSQNLMISSKRAEVSALHPPCGKTCVLFLQPGRLKAHYVLNKTKKNIISVRLTFQVSFIDS